MASTAGALSGRHRLATFAKLASLATQTVFAFRLNVYFELVGLLLQILLLKVVWTAVYQDRGEIAGTPLITLLTYLTIANIQIWVIWPETTWLLQQKIRDGKIAQDLARPVGLITQLLAFQAGSSLFFTLIAIPALPLAFFAGALTPPPTWEAALLYLISIALSFGVVTWIGLLLGLIGFWTLESTGFLMMYRFANLFFAGGLVPLWLFPDPLRVLAELLPFQTQAHIPVQIYVGRLAGMDALRGLLIQAVWILLLWLVVRWVYGRALHKVVVQGG